jgi:hypothetical protein
MDKDAGTEVFDAIILGGGAAGLMCALEAGQRGRRVIVLEGAEKAGEKDSHLRRRALQFYEPLLFFTKFYLRKSAFRQVGALAIYALRFHCAGRKTQDCVSRKNSGTVVLRPLSPRYREHAGSGVPQGRGALADQRPGLGGQPLRRIRRSHQRLGAAGISRSHTGRRDRGTVHPKDGRDGIRLRSRPPIRTENHSAAPRSRAASFRRRGSRSLCITCRHIRGRNRVFRRTTLPGKNVGHSSRPQWSGDSANFVLLAQTSPPSHRPSHRIAKSPPRYAILRGAIYPPPAKRCTDFFRIVWPTRGSNKTLPPLIRIPHSNRGKGYCTTGPFTPPAMKASTKPKSLRAESTPTNSRPRLWSRKKFPDSSSSARPSTSPAISADSTFSGLGPQALPRGGRSSSIHIPFFL